MASCSLPNQLVPQSTISSRSCCCHRKGCFTALLSAGLCSSSSIMLQQTIQLVPQHLLQLASAGRGCPERHTGPSPCWQLWQQAASASQQNMHRGEQVAAQGGPGGQGLLRGGWWMVNHGHTDRNPGLWGGQQQQYKDSRHN